MRKYLIDPNQTWCKANLHCHTTNSDGNLTPQEIKDAYLQHGYQIVAFSDHEVILDNSYLTDENFVALTSTEYSVAAATDIWQDRKVIHLNLFAKEPHNTFHPACSIENIGESQYTRFKDKIVCDGYTREFSIDSLNETIKRANEAGFLVQFNHPHWSLNSREDYIHLKGLWSLEILNYLTEIETGAEYCPYIYDDMLNSGIKLFCTMGDDNHNKNKEFVGSFGGFDYIGVDTLNYANVIDAMEKGNFYSSSGPKIHSLYVEDDKIYIECDKVKNIIFVGKNRRFRNYYGENLTKADFKIFGGEEFFRIAIVTEDGKVAHTNAYYLKDLGIDK